MYFVVIADEDRTSRDLLIQALSIDDCRIETVSLGEDALRHVAESEVDVLITDAHLPDMPAWELVPKVHQIDRHTSVIAVTADDSWETSRRTRVEGGPVFFYAIKPLNLREMQLVVRCAAAWSRKQHTGSGVPQRNQSTRKRAIP